MAKTRDDANQAFETFLKTYGAKYPKACECLKKDRDELFTFYDFPAEHWGHLRTTNPIESTSAEIRLRTKKTKGHGSRQAALAMASKLAQSARITLASPQRLRVVLGRCPRHAVRQRTGTKEGGCLASKDSHPEPPRKISPTTIEDISFRSSFAECCHDPWLAMTGVESALARKLLQATRLAAVLAL